jgi:hypothetical protein
MADINGGILHADLFVDEFIIEPIPPRRWSRPVAELTNLSTTTVRCFKSRSFS